jgi:hypothetical protein
VAISLEDIEKEWSHWTVDQRMELLRWVNAHCAQCGRKGAVIGMYCDTCCEKGMAQSELGAIGHG